MYGLSGQGEAAAGNLGLPDLLSGVSHRLHQEVGQECDSGGQLAVSRVPGLHHGRPPGLHLLLWQTDQP